MPIERNTKLGNISVSEDTIANLAGGIVSECYGVIGMSSKHLIKDNIAEILGKENYAKGIVVRKDDDAYSIDLYVILSYGVKISEVCNEVQKKVKYSLEQAFDLKFKQINIFVQGVKIID